MGVIDQLVRSGCITPIITFPVPMKPEMKFSMTMRDHIAEARKHLVKLSTTSCFQNLARGWTRLLVEHSYPLVLIKIGIGGPVTLEALNPFNKTSLL